MTSWLFFYLTASFGLILFFIRKYKHIRPQLNSIELENLAEYLDASIKFIDVRSDKEWERDSWEPAINIPHDQIAGVDFELNQKVLLVCNSGIRSLHAATTLAKRGFKEVSYFNGYHKDLIKVLSKSEY